MSDPLDKRCEHILDDGARCPSWKVTDSPYCFMHSPSRRAEAQAARSRGGQRYVNDWSPLPIRTLDEAQTFLETSLNNVAGGKISPGQMSAIASGVSAIIKVIDLRDLESRLEKVERRVNGK